MKALNGIPRIALRFLAWFCPSDLREGIEGDLLEKFEEDIPGVGLRKARARLVWTVLLLFRPSILLRNKFSWRIFNSIMIRNYITVASRNIRKRKLYSFINAFGLSIGIAFCILIYLFIKDEQSFDQFHVNKDHLYRMHSEVYDAGHTNNPKAEGPYKKMPQMQMALAPVMKAELPEVQYATHFCQSHALFRKDDKIFRESIVYVDADFFSMFSFPLEKGNPKRLFQTKEEIVLTPALAEKYFGSKDPVGQVITIYDRPMTVTGIITEPPANSSLQFQALLPIESWGLYNQHNLDKWINLGFATFVQLYPGTDLNNLQTKLEALRQKYMKDETLPWLERDAIPVGYSPYKIGFSNITAIHLQKEIWWDKVSDPEYAWILGGIAILILFIACINYISLALTSSAGRRIEVGIRKVVGAYRRELIYQFTFESVMLALMSMFIGFGLVTIFLPAFNEFTGKGISITLNDIISLSAVSIALTVVVGLLAGCYPALYLSRFRPAQVLKGLFTGRLSAGFSKPLVVCQFILSSFLIISSVVMYRQMRFVTTKDLGYNQHQVIVIPTQAGWGEDSNAVVEQFRQQAAGIPAVISVAGTDYPFAGNDWMVYGYKVNGENKATHGFNIDTYFLNTLGIQLVQGRGFDINNPADTTKTIVVNEALVKDMGWANPLDEHLNFHMGDPNAIGARVIGVVKDFHFLSLEENIKPMFFSMDRNDGSLNHILVRVSPDNIPATLTQLQNVFRKVAPEKPFEYSFLDDNVARQYASFDRWTNIMAFSAIFAIIISCLGLFGLAGINAVNRTKEIGIRKVMGAEVMNIFIMLNKQFVWLSLIAFALAAPLAWYAMKQWLGSFQFHIDMTWYLFAAGMLVGLAVALTAVSYHAVKAARVNPADSLKYE